MIVRLNIGMESHGIGASVIKQMLQNAIGTDNVVTGYHCVMSDGGDWEPELIMVPEIQVSNVERLKKGLVALCDVLSEDSIAVAILSPDVGNGVLVWNTNYTGERYSFNLDYFTG